MFGDQRLSRSPFPCNLFTGSFQPLPMGFPTAGEPIRRILPALLEHAGRPEPGAHARWSSGGNALAHRSWLSPPLARVDDECRHGCKQVKFFVLLLDLDGDGGMVCDLFRVLFESIKCAALFASCNTPFTGVGK
jgi:hypothetical protein